ncbi:MAG TPA: ATPase domain-containing protein, partial [Actinomycetota bacterium]
MDASFECAECRRLFPRWFGRCPSCGAWNSARRPRVGGADAEVVPFPSREGSAERRPCGIGELDRVAGGGLVQGSVVLLSGEPGAGKSTLALQLLGSCGGRGLLVAAEESPSQVALRAARLGCDLEAGRLVAATAVEDVCSA